MTKLTSNQESFIKMMMKGEEYEHQGFELLLKRNDYENFFDALLDAGLFEPSRNLGPVQAEQPNSYWVPYWQPLAYLEAVAKLAGERGDADLGRKVMGVVRSVSNFLDADGKPRDNYRTWFTFAKIIGLVPTECVSFLDIDLMPIWLAGRLDHSMVGHSVASVTLRSFVCSDRAEDWTKACRIVHHCTAIEWLDDKWLDDTVRKKPRTVVEDFWLREIIKVGAAPLGHKSGKDIAEVFANRLKELFAPQMEGRATWLARPAIEDHSQNHTWESPENRLVEGLRDALLAWLDANPQTASLYVEQLLSSQFEIHERIAIHVVNERFPALRGLVAAVLRPALFDSNHLHEMYHLLKAHFLDFTGEEKATTLSIIRTLPTPERDKDSERILRRIQHNWLSAIAGQGYQPAEEWILALTADPTLGPLSPHPDFNSYHTSHWGSGPTPHSVQDLANFAESGVIVEKLNAFVQTDFWDGPTTRSLADAVVEAVGIAPLTFLKQLPAFHGAKFEYQYAVIAGFKKLWDAWDGKKTDLDWFDIWSKLISFFEKLLGDEEFWKAEVTDTRALLPNRNWIPPVISDFLKSGTHSDSKAYDPAFLPRTWSLITLLLGKLEPEKEPREDDALNRAINSSRGKTIEAMINHALRSCRVNDQVAKSHTETWRAMQPAFDVEVEACHNANFDFSALAGAYVVNFHYMDAEWVHANFRKIFSTEYPANCLSALDGLAFAPATEPIYKELVDAGVIEWALRQELKGRHSKENLIQRMSLAYLWDKEQLESPRFSYLFEARRTGDLGIATRYFWSVRGEPLEKWHKDKIVTFWDRCVRWSKEIDPTPTKLLSKLSLLSCYLDAIDERGLTLLLAVAPHVSLGYNADSFVEQLLRLVAVSPTGVAQALTAMLDGYNPSFDFEDRVKKIVLALAENKETRSDALSCLNRMRNLPGMLQLYNSLVASPRQS